MAPVEVRAARFLWRHRTVVAGLAALWNVAFIWVGPLTIPDAFSPVFPRVVAIVGALIFATLCVISFVYDRRKGASSPRA
ncbi:hypothetical protein ACFPJ4_07620 [Lysinimonas soli]|uniref:Uncharacterized protein n=1 Tax=Lysinimonas soli TaxID=1074233 RepID=A0ABW0NS09_9MICO